MSESVSRRKFMAGAFGAAAVPMFAEPLKAVAEPLKAVADSLVADRSFELVPKAPSQKIKIGFIGVGGRGNALLGCLLRGQQAELVAICDIRPEAIEAATKRCEGMSPKGYADYRDLLADSNVETVFIATPVDLHCEMAVATLEAGKHLYCEKPLGLNAKEAEKVAKAAEKAPNQVFQVGFQWMYNPNFVAAIEAIHEGRIGEVRFIHARRHGSGDLPQDKKWLMDRERSGDIIVEQAVHEMNVFCWGLKSHPEKAWGTGGIGYYVDTPPGRTVMDNYALSMLFPNEVHLAYSHMFFAPRPLDGMAIHFFGTKGAVDVMRGEIYLPEGEKVEPRPMQLSGDDTFNAVYSFCQDVINGGKPRADAQGALLATKTAVLGRTALYKGKAATWNRIS